MSWIHKMDSPRMADRDEENPAYAAEREESRNARDAETEMERAHFDDEIQQW